MRASGSFAMGVLAFAMAGCESISNANLNGGNRASKAAVTSACVISSPAAGATVGSPVEVDGTCAAGAGHDIVAVKIYVDTVENWSEADATPSVDVAQALPLSAGAHALTLQAWDDSSPQNIYKAHASITVSAGCTVASPADGATVASPVGFDATCTALAGHDVVGVHVYVDGVSAWTSGTTTGNQVQVTPQVTMAAGTHAVTVQAWDDSAPQNIYKTPLTLTVAQAGCAVATPADGATVDSPVPFDATCTALPGRNVVGVKIYVDGAAGFDSGTTTGNPVHVAPSVAMSAGAHAVTVQEWDDSSPQNIYKTHLSLTVNGSGAAPAPAGNGDTSAAGFVSSWTLETAANGANPNFGDANTTTTAGHDVTSNGNLTPPPNISRVPFSTLLGVPVYAHLMPWFQLSNTKHAHVSYSSDDPAVVDAQIKDMVARGVAGVIADWYGQSDFKEPIMQVWKAEVGKYNAGQLAFQNGQVPQTKLDRKSVV